MRFLKTILVAFALSLCNYASATLSLVQNSGVASANSATTVTSAAITTTTSNTLCVAVVAKKASGGHTLAISDSKSNTAWRLVLNTSNPGTGVALRFYVCDSITGGANHTVTVTDNAASSLSIVVTELTATNGLVYADTLIAGGSGTDTAAATTATTLLHGSAIVLGAVTQTTGGTVTITPGTGYSTLAKDEGGTNQPISVIAASDLSGSVQPSWTLGSSVAYRAIGVSFREVGPAPATAYTQQPTWRYDMRDCRAFLTETNISLPEHAGGTLAVTGGTTVAAGVGSFTSLTVATGTISLPATSLGTIAATLKTDGFILGANEVGNGANGAYWLKSATRNLSARIVTDSGSISVTDGSGATGMPDVPIVVMLTATTGASAIITCNGFDVGTTSITGNSLAGTALTLFAQYVSGSVTNQASGSFYEVRGYSTPINSAADRLAISKEMAWPFGAPITRRFLQSGFRNDTETAVSSESVDATSFSALREISYAPVLSTVRDVGLYYHAANQTWYAFHTSGSFAGVTYFEVAKFKDPRMWLPHKQVDVSGTVGTKPSVAPEPVVNPATGVISHIATEEAGGTAFYLIPVTDIAAGTFGTATTVTGVSGSDPYILYPADPRNIWNAGSYTVFTAVNPTWKSASAIGGSYSGGATFFTGNNFEGCDPLLLDTGKTRVFCTGDTGYGYIDVSANGSATAIAITRGLNTSTGAAYEVGQGDVMDLKQLGLWTSPPNVGTSGTIPNQYGMHVGGGVNF
jgi:hypothetical protein